MRFESPLYLLLLILIPVLFKIWIKNEALPRIQVSTYPEKPETSTGFKKWLSSFAFISTLLKSIAFGLLVIALARPQSISKTQERNANGIDIVMVLDVSLSMLIQDMGDRNRMEIAKDTFKSFIEGRSSDRVGFVIFSGEPLTLAPPTLDYGLLLQQLQTVQAGGGGLRDGTAIGDGLALAIHRLKKSIAKSRVIILLTDGDNNVGRIDPMTSGELAEGYGIKVYSIAIGTEGRVLQPLPQQTAMGTVYTKVWVENRLNPKLLEEISNKTNGKFFRVTDENTLQKVFKEIDQLEKSEVTIKDKVRYDELFYSWAFTGFILLIFNEFLSLVYWRKWA